MVFNKTSTFGALVFAAGAAFVSTPAIAQTGVTISGAIDTEINTQTSQTTGKRITSLNGVSTGPNGGLQTSYLEFAGVEDLGDGLKAGFSLGMFILPGTGNSGRFNGDPLFSRDANILLSGDMGTLKLGRQISPLFLSTLLFNPFADSFSYSAIIQHTYNAGQFEDGSGNVISADSGYSNAISYATPNYDGFRAELLYSASGQNGTSGSYSGNVLYFNGPFAATLAYESSTVTGSSNNTFTLGGSLPPGTTQKTAQLGLSYDLQPVKLFLQLQNNNTSVGGNSPSVSNGTYQIGASIAAGSGNVLASYAHTGGAIDHKTFSLGYDYKLSRRTDTYIAYMTDSAAAYADTINSFGIGLRHRF
ncbi:MAG: porin [Burkholderiaceae bacterium]|nr:porin [Burkholderiaceae bacterium]